jgi:hypothetical protein
MNPIKSARRQEEGARKRIIRPLSLGVAPAHHGASLHFSLFFILTWLSLCDEPKGLVKPRLHLIRRNKKEFPSTLFFFCSEK